MTASAGSVIVTLYTREGCHLCDEARAAIAPAIVRVGAELREIDIDDDAELRAMYNDSVRLIFVGGDFFGRYRVDAKKFEKALEAAGRKAERS
jgi:glutaredoxin